MKDCRKYYVYRLLDPRTGLAFYVGKGTGRRAWSHEARARKGKVDNAPKHLAICEIHAAGLNVTVEIVLDKTSETEAFALERQMIEEAEGLTNIAGGCVSNEQRVTTQAREMLSRMRTFNGWVAVAGPERLAACERIKGSARAFYEESLDWMLSVSGFSPQEQASVRASAFV